MAAPRLLLGLSAWRRAPLGVPFQAQSRALFQKTRVAMGPYTTGHSVLAVCAAPFLYSAAKSIYMTMRMRWLDTQEILSDRFTWLHERMLEDEVDALLIDQVANSNVDRTQPLLRLGPSYITLLLIFEVLAKSKRYSRQPMLYNSEVKVTLCPMLKPLSPWGGVLAFLAARRLSRSSTRNEAETAPNVTAEGEVEVQARSQRAIRSERRRLQAELRERAQLELAKVRAFKYQACRDPSQLQPGVAHTTFSSAKPSREKQQSKRAAVTISTNEDPPTNDFTQRPQPVKKPGLAAKLQALFSLVRKTVDTDSSSSSDSSQDDGPTNPRLLVGPPQAVLRRSCLRVERSPKERALARLTSRVDWSPVVEAAKFCKVEPTAICIVRDENGVLKPPAPLRV